MKKRRQFLKLLGFGAGALLLGNKKAIAAECKAADPSKGTPLAMKYQSDKSKVDKSLQMAKGGVDFKAQFCDNCMHYEAKDKACKLFMATKDCIVKPKGWCFAWIAKPK